MVRKIDFVCEGHRHRAGYVYFVFRYPKPTTASVSPEMYKPTTRKFRWLICCIAFFPPSAVCRCWGQVRTFSGNHPPASSRNRIRIESESWALFQNLTDKMSYRKISWSLEAARLVVQIIASLWNLTGTPGAVLPMCLSNFRAIGQFYIQISRLRDFRRSYIKTCLHME